MAAFLFCSDDRDLAKVRYDSRRYPPYVKADDGADAVWHDHVNVV